MKKNILFYVLIWIILLAVFNLIVFVISPMIPNYVRDYDTLFWVSWGTMTASFIGNLLLAFLTFNSKNSKMVFYRIPMLSISYVCMIGSFVLCCLFILIAPLPILIGIVISVVFLALHLIAIIKAWANANIVSSLDEKKQQQTAFIQLMRTRAQIALTQAKSDISKLEANKVVDELRYSDPISNEQLVEVENNLLEVLNTFFNAIKVGENDEAIQEMSNQCILLIKERNALCRTLK